MTTMDNRIGFVFDKTTGVGLYSLRLSADLDWGDHLLPEEGVLVGEVTKDVGNWTVDDVNNPTILLPNPNAPAIAVTLDSEKASAKFQIDETAASYRTRFISIGYGQEMTYLEKERQARAYLMDTSQAIGAFPMLTGEAGVKGVTVEACALTIVQMADAWKIAGAAIETARLAAKNQIDLAEDVTAINEVVDTFQIAV